jgi:hypothetical protein
MSIGLNALYGHDSPLQMLSMWRVRLSHYPIILALLWATESPWWAYIIVAILSQAIWWQAKSSEGRDWPNKGEQLWNWISR